MNMKVGLLNTTIVTGKGLFSCMPLTVDEAREIVQYNPTESHVGHQATADSMATLLGVPVQMNRSPYSQTQPGQKAICLKVKGRIEEGRILTREELEAIGYEFFLLKKVANSEEEFISTIEENYAPITDNLQKKSSEWKGI